jgi:hypothetical protein
MVGSSRLGLPVVSPLGTVGLSPASFKGDNRGNNIGPPCAGKPVAELQSQLAKSTCEIVRLPRLKGPPHTALMSPGHGDLVTGLEGDL